jgi:O-antigen/teichoic acid export membrane protein
MGQIRRQTILSSLSSYIGFLVGALNTYLFVRAGVGSFTTAQYGLTRAFTDIGQMMYAFGSLGVPYILYKFLPYYKDNLAKKDNDLLTWVLALVTLGFAGVLLSGWVFEPLIIRKYSSQSALFVFYYRWAFPFGLGYLYFCVLEAYAVAMKHSVYSTFLREGAVRVYVSILILPFTLHLISFDTFIKIFSLQYVCISITLWLYLRKRHLTHLTFQQSKVTRRLKKKIISMLSLVYGGIIIQIVAQSLDGLLIMGFKGLAYTGVYAFLVYVANVIQVPQRSVQYVAIPHLSKAWKDKDMGTISRIYHRTSINLLIISSFLFCLIMLCYENAIPVFHIKAEYAPWFGALFLLGIARVIDSGTGVNSHIIGTSTYWKFEFFTGVIFLAFRIPLNILLIKHYGILGSAIADLISMVIYNGIRWAFLAIKFKMQPFNYKSGLTLLYAAAAYTLVWWSCASLNGWTSLFVKCILFGGIYGVAVLVSNLTPDAAQVWEGVKKKLRI